MSADLNAQNAPYEQLLMRRPWLEDLPQPPPLPQGFCIRTASDADAPALAELMTAAYNEPWDAERVRRELTAAPDVQAVYVVVDRTTCADGDILVATTSARVDPAKYPGSGYVHYVGANTAYLGRGFGTLVTWRVLQHFQDAGLADAVLETDDFRLPALRSYLRLGFVPEYRSASHKLRWARLLTVLVK